MTTLVTGAAGFIGSHVAERLLERGERVVGIDNFDPYYDPALKRANAERLARHPNATMLEADIRDREGMRALFEQHRFARVAHMAAMAGVRLSVEDPLLYVAVNTTGTAHLLEGARRVGTRMFVLASTSSVYGATERLPFCEDDAADHPLAPYPASKRGAEILAHSFHHLFGLHVTAVRFFNVYGPAGRPDMMPLRLMDAITHGKPITVYNGGDIHRDWTYIDDTVDGVLAALDRPLGYQVINLGLGAPVSLSAFIDRVEALAGRKLVRVEAPTPASDPPITYCNNEKARRLLGFAPSVSVDVGLERTWQWFVGR
jgi:UDP-glucuronate 4-epimerase